MENKPGQVMDVLRRFSADLIMLDGFWQWSTNPTTNAGYALKENSDLITGNLRKRYKLTREQANEAVAKLNVECNNLARGAEIYELQKQIQVALSGKLGTLLRDEVIRRINKASLTARCTIALIRWLIAEHFSDPNIDIRSDKPCSVLQVLLRSVLEGIPEFEVKPVQDSWNELIECGILNSLYYLSSSGLTKSAVYKYGVPIPDLALADVMADYPKPDMKSFVSKLFKQNYLEQARLLGVCPSNILFSFKR